MLSRDDRSVDGVETFRIVLGLRRELRKACYGVALFQGTPNNVKGIRSKFLSDLKYCLFFVSWQPVLHLSVNGDKCFLTVCHRVYSFLY
jgi:hypothetical protein